MLRYLRRRVEEGVYLVCAVLGTWNMLKGAAFWYVASSIERSRQPPTSPAQEADPSRWD